MSQIHSHLGRLGKTYRIFTVKEAHKHFKIHSCHMVADKLSRIGWGEPCSKTQTFFKTRTEYTLCAWTGGKSVFPLFLTNSVCSL